MKVAVLDSESAREKQTAMGWVKATATAMVMATWDIRRWDRIRTAGLNRQTRPSTK
jgi:hypothetical protein